MIKPPYVIELFVTEPENSGVHWRIVNYLRGGDKVTYTSGEAPDVDTALKQIRTTADGC